MFLLRLNSVFSLTSYPPCKPPLLKVSITCLHTTIAQPCQNISIPLKCQLTPSHLHHFTPFHLSVTMPLNSRHWTANLYHTLLHMCNCKIFSEFLQYCQFLLYIVSLHYDIILRLWKQNMTIVVAIPRIVLTLSIHILLLEIIIYIDILIYNTYQS